MRRRHKADRHHARGRQGDSHIGPKRQDRGGLRAPTRTCSLAAGLPDRDPAVFRWQTRRPDRKPVPVSQVGIAAAAARATNPKPLTDRPAGDLIAGAPLPAHRLSANSPEVNQSRQRDQYRCVLPSRTRQVRRERASQGVALILVIIRAPLPIPEVAIPWP